MEIVTKATEMLAKSNEITLASINERKDTAHGENITPHRARDGR
jgi:hypothetical protein